MTLTMHAAVAELARICWWRVLKPGWPGQSRRARFLARPATTPPKQRADIFARHKFGASISELSRLHGVSRATVMRIARLEGAQA
jgi:hypothetical protein